MKDSAFAGGAERLTVIGRAGAGIDKIDLAACTENDVAVFNAPDTLTHATASSAFLLILALAKRLGDQQALVRDGRWDLQPQVMGVDLPGKVLGIVGLGASGRELARLMQPWGMDIVACSPRADPDVAAALGVRLLSSLDELLQISDFVSLHNRLDAHTRGMIGAAEFRRMKRGAFFINVARGEIVREGELVEALRDGTIAGAGLDVFEHEPLAADHPLTSLGNVILTPHWLPSTRDAARLTMVSIATGIIAAAARFRAGQCRQPPGAGAAGLPGQARALRPQPQTVIAIRGKRDVSPQSTEGPRARRPKIFRHMAAERFAGLCRDGGGRRLRLHHHGRGARYRGAAACDRHDAGGRLHARPPSSSACPSADPVYLRRLVDAGAEALLVPMVETAEQARAIVEAVRFPPRGKRGNAFDATRSSSFGLVPDYYDRADDNLLIIVQIETMQGVENAREIAGVDGVDVIFIGPTDLSGSIGLPGQTGAPEVDKQIRRAMAAARDAGKPLATVPRIGRSNNELFDEGFVMIASGSDIYFYRLGITQLMKEWREYNGDAGEAGGGRAVVVRAVKSAVGGQFTFLPRKRAVVAELAQGARSKLSPALSLLLSG